MADLNTLLSDGLLLRDQVVPAIEELEASSGSQAAEITTLQNEVNALESQMPTARQVLVSIYMPDLVGANADAQVMRFPAFNGYRITSIRANASKSRDGDVILTMRLGATNIGATPITITGSSPGGGTTVAPLDDNTYSGTAFVIEVSGANTLPCDGYVFLILSPPT